MTTVCSQLKLLAADGKRYNTDVAETAGLLRVIESIPSPEAEPFKMWLAQVGKERMEETIDPELTINRALETYSRLGYSPEWINQRMRTIQARNELTDEWKAHGVEANREYAILTDEVTKTVIFSEMESALTLRASVSGSDLDCPGAPRQNNTMRSSAAMDGVRLTDGVILPFQTRPANAGLASDRETGSDLDS